MRDEILPSNAGRWRLTTTAETSNGLAAACVPPAGGRPGAGRDRTRRGVPGGTRLGALAAAPSHRAAAGRRPAALGRPILGPRSLVPAGLLAADLLPAGRGCQPGRDGALSGFIRHWGQEEDDAVPAMKLTPNAAMRARDVSRPRAEHLAEAEAAEGSATAARENPGRQSTGRRGRNGEARSRRRRDGQRGAERMTAGVTGDDPAAPGLPAATPGTAGRWAARSLFPLRSPPLRSPETVHWGAQEAGRPAVAGLLVIGDHGQAPGVTRLSGERVRRRPGRSRPLPRWCTSARRG